MILHVWKSTERQVFLTFDILKHFLNYNKTYTRWLCNVSRHHPVYRQGGQKSEIPVRWTYIDYYEKSIQKMIFGIHAFSYLSIYKSMSRESQTFAHLAIY